MHKQTVKRLTTCAAVMIVGSLFGATRTEAIREKLMSGERDYVFVAMHRGDRAHRYLKDFQRAFVSRSGFHLNGDQLKCGLSRYTYRPFTLEGNFGYARGIQEMLLSYDPHTNTYRLFPALPKEWDGKEVSFRGLRLPGGHRVSAKRAADGTVTHTLVPNPRARTVPNLN